MEDRIGHGLPPPPQAEVASAWKSASLAGKEPKLVCDTGHAVRLAPGRLSPPTSPCGV